MFELREDPKASAHIFNFIREQHLDLDPDDYIGADQRNLLIFLSMYFYSNLYLEEKMQFSGNNNFVRAFGELLNLMPDSEFIQDENRYYTIREGSFQLIKILFEG